jgi:hypothetical protein
MIIVSVHLVSAIDGSVTELARAHIANIGGGRTIGDYEVKTLRGRDTKDLNGHVVQRAGKVIGHRRLALHVWHLVSKALQAVGYGTERGSQAPQAPMLPLERRGP